MIEQSSNDSGQDVCAVCFDKKMLAHLQASLSTTIQEIPLKNVMHSRLLIRSKENGC